MNNPSPSKSNTQPPKAVSRLSTDFRHIMVSLEPQVLKQHPASKTKGRWQGRFIVAAWVRFPEGLTQRVSLMLVFRDSKHRKSYKIDACRANRQSLILLNGTMDLDIEGEISEIALVLEGLSEDSVWILDEYRIEPAGAARGKMSNLKTLESA